MDDQLRYSEDNALAKPLEHSDLTAWLSFIRSIIQRIFERLLEFFVQTSILEMNNLNAFFVVAYGWYDIIL